MKTNKTMAIGLLAVSLMGGAAPATRACVWVSGTTIDGGHKRVGGSNPLRRVIRAMDETPESRLNDLRGTRDFAADDSPEAIEFSGVELLLSGKPDAAVEVFLRLENEHPGRYSTAANLGTAYELSGKNELALKWIREGIARNEDSHHGTEWVHVAILEAKSALERNPDWLKQRRVLELPKEFSRGDKIPLVAKPRAVKDIAQAILYQLEERVVFVKPRDPIVADLLFTFARIQARTGVVENGLKALKLAREYGFADKALMAATVERYERVIWWGEIRWYSTLAAGMFGAVWFLRYAYRRKWFFLSGKDYAAHRASLADNQ